MNKKCNFVFIYRNNNIFSQSFFLILLSLKLLLVNQKQALLNWSCKKYFSCHYKIVKVFQNTFLALKYHSIYVALVFSRSLGMKIKTRSRLFSPSCLPFTTSCAFLLSWCRGSRKAGNGVGEKGKIWYLLCLKWIKVINLYAHTKELEY